MKSRLDKLIMVRRTASRVASGAFADSAARAGHHASLVDRLDSATRMLAPDVGVTGGGSLAAQLELAERMRAAGSLARDRAATALNERHDAAVARKAAIRALDAAVDIRRAGDQAATVRREAKAVPLPVKGRP